MRVFDVRRAGPRPYFAEIRWSLPKLPGLQGYIIPLIAVFVFAVPCAGWAEVQQAQPESSAPASSPAPVPSVNPAPTSPAGPDSAKPSANTANPPADTAQPADTPVLSTAGTGSALIPHDLSPYGMFMHADIVVKTVMVGLAVASLATWTILLAKTLELFGARTSARKGLAVIAEAATLRDAAAALQNRNTPAVRLVDAALAEAERSRGLAPEGVKERAAALLSRIEARAGRAMGRGTGVLATVGSTAPFIGLFGTVWGIMNSFIGISKTNTTNLAVVAPGIAEALLATASGLVAAIPAVIIYNMFARGITGYRQVLGDASTEVLRLLSRDLDRDAARGVPVGRQAAE